MDVSKTTSVSRDGESKDGTSDTERRTRHASSLSAIIQLGTHLRINIISFCVQIKLYVGD